uniref:Uncharacterized protein n=1 Tax=Cucumis melo TaxID=3656 RepID=A0A9I9DQX0_CUCME
MRLLKWNLKKKVKGRMKRISHWPVRGKARRRLRVKEKN